MQFSNSSSGTGVSTRASGRVTRASELRAVKLDSAGLVAVAASAQLNLPQTAIATPKALPTSQINPSESLLKPAKTA